MKAILRLRGEIHPKKQRSTGRCQQSAMSYQLSALDSWLPAKSRLLPKTYYLISTKEPSAVSSRLSDMARHVRAISKLKPKTYQLSAIASQLSGTDRYARVMSKLIAKACYFISGRVLSNVSNQPSGLSSQSSALNRRLPTQYRLSPNTYKRIPLILYILVFVSCGAAMAQEHGVHTAPAAKAESEITPLKIGDKIPEELWDLPLQVVSHHEGKESITLNDYRGKLIILDFWATWCGSCIKNIPKMEYIQQQFKETAKVIMVSGQEKEKVREFLSKHKFKLRSVTDDNYLKHFFPHLYIPHYAVIAPDGTIGGITSSDQITKENLHKIIEGANPDMKKKEDKSTDLPLFSSGGLPIGQLRHSSTFFKGILKGYPSGIRQRHYDKEQIAGVSYTNVSLLSLFKVAIRNLHPHIPSNRIIFNVQDSSKLYYISTSISMQEWYKENLYSYELLYPLDSGNEMYKEMLQDLNHFSSFTGSLLKKKIRCLKLVVLEKRKPIGTSFDKTVVSERSKDFQNVPVTALVNYLDGSKLRLPIIDGTGFNGKISFTISADFKDPNTIKKELNRYNLDLVEVDQEMEVFVIADKVSGSKQII